MEYCKTTIYNEGLKWPLPAEFSLQKENWNLNFIAKLNIYISEAQKHGVFFFIYIILIQMPSNLIILWKHKKKHLSVILPLFSELFFFLQFSVLFWTRLTNTQYISIIDESILNKYGNHFTCSIYSVHFLVKTIYVYTKWF